MTLCQTEEEEQTLSNEFPSAVVRGQLDDSPENGLNVGNLRRHRLEPQVLVAATLQGHELGHGRLEALHHRRLELLVRRQR